MEAAQLLDIARHARTGRPKSQPQRALVCKIARQHLRKRPASASGSSSKSRPALQLEAQIKTANLVHAVVDDDRMHVPEESDTECIGANGTGRWRMWNARTSLRVGYQAGNASANQLALTMVPARSRGHVVEVQNAVACVTLDKAKAVLKKATSVRDQNKHKFFINDFGLDSTELHVHVQGKPPMSQHVLAVHGHSLWKERSNKLCQCPLVYAPRVLRNNNASCTWSALTSECVPLEPIPPSSGEFADWSGTVVSHDQHVVNYCIIHKMLDLAGDTHLVASDACLQHRTANCLSPMTKHLSIAPGIFCLAAVERHGSLYTDVLTNIETRLSHPGNIREADDDFIPDAGDREFAESLLEVTYFEHERMNPADLEMSELELEQLRQQRRRNGEALMRLLPGNWRQGVHLSISQVHLSIR